MTDGGFSKDERDAMKQRARELREEAKLQKAADKQAAALQGVLDAFAAMPPEERAIAEWLHGIVLEHAPGLSPKTWYGFPAYADADGKPVVFFQPGSKFGTRYSTLGFQDPARLDEGTMWPTSYALTAVDPANEERVAELVRRAVGG
ncbi:uncharacterized protein YdhG (YjbR/CyaY superfamily) [Clavibacter michiganensis]|uniref:iron chaperone n=1 Tax=Clavibacter michiganensis TaxID=28447 RepID=UPI00195934A5|nr:DUF1801 domain-containing protein [Clavibacter michiganensis]MBM7410414.1 uncharacterized protein YdhG (YjbR/CyaY superfamily) [Clavibacter michiganensis]